MGVQVALSYPGVHSFGYMPRSGMDHKVVLFSTKESKVFIGEKTASSTNGAGKIGLPSAED
jgi:hypothetical protein